MARAPNPLLLPALRDAATDVFAEHGLAASKVSDITVRAGVSKGAFYLHFESKEALYEQIARDFVDEVVAHLSAYQQQLRGAGAVPGPEVMERLTGADEALLDLLWTRRKPLAMVLQGAVGTPSAKLTDEFIDAIERTMLDSVTRHHAELALPAPLQPSFIAAMATGLIVMYARRLLIAKERPQIAADVGRFRRIITLGAVLSDEQIDGLLGQLLAPPLAVAS
jgi:AcrR family transcriptional regulator